MTRSGAGAEVGALRGARSESWAVASIALLCRHRPGVLINGTFVIPITTSECSLNNESDSSTVGREYTKRDKRGGHKLFFSSPRERATQSSRL